MGKKITKKKKAVKVDPRAEEKAYLSNIINHLDMCAKDRGETTELGLYFKSKADLNRERLKNIS